VDFLVDCDPEATLRDLYALQAELGNFLNASVDVIERDGLKPRDTHIRGEALAL
jgi:predicted nucleotidyltransferase